MVARLILFLFVIVGAIAAGGYLTYRYYDRQAQRRHEQKMARERRNYDAVMEYATDENQQSPEQTETEKEK